MAATSAPPSQNNTPAVDQQPAPPEEHFWQHYSQHHEFPLSSVISLVLHGVVIALLVYWGLIYGLMGLDKKDKPLPLDEIVVAGGGGNPGGVEGNQPGTVLPQHGTEAVENPITNPNPTENKIPQKEEDLPPPPTDQFKVPEDLNERIVSTTANPSISGVAKMSNDVQKQLFRGLTVSKGKGGSGSGGGEGSGHGTGTGNASGAGKANISERQKRVLRWTMIFNTSNGGDYLKQLEYFKAILAVPLPQGGNQYELMDLTKRPVIGRQATYEELGQLKRIFWVDNQPGSVGSLGHALQLPFQPPMIIAFFPASFEQELLDKEHTFRGLEENQIKETKFQIVPKLGGYEPKVIQQIPN